MGGRLKKGVVSERGGLERTSKLRSRTKNSGKEKRVF